MSPLSRLPRSGTLAEQAADRLRASITDGVWPVGTRVPAEHDLVEQLGVSRNTVREALRGLVHTGLLEARVGDGTYVIATSELRSAISRRSATSTPDEVMELRAVLEEHAAALAARRAVPEDIATLRALLAVATGERVDMERIAAADRRFHREVARISGNGLLADLHEHLGAAVSEVVGGLEADYRIADEHAALHDRLVDSIEAHDEAGARLAAVEIVAVVRRVGGPSNID